MEGTDVEGWRKWEIFYYDAFLNTRDAACDVAALIMAAGAFQAAAEVQGSLSCLALELMRPGVEAAYEALLALDIDTLMDRAWYLNDHGPW